MFRSYGVDPVRTGHAFQKIAPPQGLEPWTL